MQFPNTPFERGLALQKTLRRLATPLAPVLKCRAMRWLSAGVIAFACSVFGCATESRPRHENRTQPVTPVLSLAPGTYPYGTAIELLEAGNDGQFYYTLDGSPPGANSRIYKGPLRLDSDHSADGVMRLRVVRIDGDMVSETAAADFQIAPGLVVHFKKPKAWGTPFIHYWGSVPDGVDTTWPGQPMAAEADGWYVATVPGQSAAGLVFNDKGKAQTRDLHRAREGWFDGSEWHDRHPDHARRFAFPGGKLKALVVSMDDNHVEDRQLVTLMNQHGVRGTFHVNSGKLDQESFLTSGEIKTLFAGHEVSTHGVSHPFLTKLDEAGMEAELLPDRAALSALSGQAVRGHAYPFGDYNDTVVEVLAEHGFAYARVVEVTNDYRLPGDLLRWRGSSHHQHAMPLIAPFVNAQPSEPMLLFIWGHSWELSANQPNNNWTYMDGMLGQLGGKSDVWYATALEVADYLRAIGQVRPALDREGLRNPGPQSVWLQTESGPTLLLPAP